jgi:hypothetical protein
MADFSFFGFTRRSTRAQSNERLLRVPKAPGSHNLSTIPKLLAKDARLLPNSPMLYSTIDFKQWIRRAEDRASWITNIVTPIIYQAKLAEITEAINEESSKRRKRAENTSSRKRGRTGEAGERRSNNDEEDNDNQEVLRDTNRGGKRAQEEENQRRSSNRPSSTGGAKQEDDSM